jgi:lipopolysaccharide biosynthesis regulator YciM
MRGLRYQAALADPDSWKALRQLRGILREDRSFVPARVSAGDLFVREGRPTLARRMWERGARRRPAAVLLQRIAELDAREKRPERTTRLYRRLLRRHPDAALRLLFARHLVEQDALDDAAAVLRELDAPVASGPVAQTLWGELYRRQGHHDQASAAFAQGLGPAFDARAFRCASCGRAIDAWEGYCPACRRWDTARAGAELAASALS